MSEFKYEIGEVVGVYKILDRWRDTTIRYKCQCTLCGHILETTQQEAQNFINRKECFHCRIVRSESFKYEVGQVIGNYQIIDRKLERNSKGIKSKVYFVKCLSCGYITKRREPLLTESELSKHHCKGCKQTTKDSRYKVGDVVNGLLILDVFKVKKKAGKYYPWTNRYKVQCVKDGYIYEISQSNLMSGKKCPVCCNQKIVRGINDIATTAPWMMPLLANPEDGYIYSTGTNKKVIWKCPDCGTLTKPLAINEIYSLKHIPCRACGDGAPITEKFLFNILKSNNIAFETQKTFEWSEHKYYDFYLTDYNIIIETHGGQHYTSSPSSRFKSKIEDIQLNDKNKYDMAKPHVKEYIIIDCSSSAYSFLLQQYKNSLSKWIDITQDYQVEYLQSIKSRVIVAKDMWNATTMSVHEIATELKITDNTVRRYLNVAKKLKLLTRQYGA